ncbi:MAG: type IV secretory system conjugative DNA transfer family protein [Actinomycetaceae bacterium]|nr:type IV secretory system conjugative DNA transfer family protein [Actinomycetaceae bacterium]
MSKKKIVAMTLIALGMFWLGNHVTVWLRAALPYLMATDEATKQAGEAAAQAALEASLPFLSFDKPDLIGGAAGIVIALLIYLYNMGSRETRAVGEEHGSAAWGTPRDLKPYSESNPAKRLSFTKTENLSLDTRKTRRNLNVCVIGASGTGKTRSYMLPNIRKADMSKAITDPKGEIYRDTAQELQDKGYKIRAFNLVDFSQSDHFNPFVYFDPDNPETSIAQLAETIITNTSGGDMRQGKSEDFWDKAERALLTALMAYVYVWEPSPSLVDVIDLHKDISNKKGEKGLTDLKFEDAAALLENGADNELNAQEKALLSYAVRQWRVYQQGSHETRQGIAISVGVRLAPLDMESVRNIIANDTIGLDAIGDKDDKTALYLIIPDTHQTFRFLAAMFWQTFFAQTIYKADHSEGGHLATPVHVYLDEFANIGRIANFPQFMATIRSRGLSVSLAVQNMAQGEAVWGKDWSTVVSNCDTVLFLGSRDEQTTQWVSKQLGDQTISYQTASVSKGMHGNYTQGEQITRRALMTPDEIATLDNNKAITLIRGLRPFLGNKL